MPLYAAIRFSKVRKKLYVILELSSFRYKSDILSNIF